MTTIETLRAAITQVILGKRHANYEHTVKHAEWAYSIMTGKRQEELVVSYKPRETDEQKKQRIAIYNPKTAYCGNRVRSQCSELRRLDNVVDNVYYADTGKVSESNVQKIQEVMQDHGLKVDIHQAVEYLNFFDPNGGILTEVYEHSAGGHRFRPVKVYSEEILDYQMSYKDLDWIVIGHPITYMVKDGNPQKGVQKMKEAKGFKYYGYAADLAVTFEEVGEGTVAEKGQKLIEVAEANAEATTNGKRYFLVTELLGTGSGKTPFLFAGFMPDPETREATYVSILYPAKDIAKDLINTKAELDLARALHGFYQKYAYVPACDFRHEEKGPCRGGRLNDETECPKCKGAGLIFHTTVQEVVMIKAPEGREEHIPLEQFVHYVTMPEFQMKMQKEDLDQAVKEFSIAIFNANVHDRTEIAVTATEKRINMQGVQNVLYELGQIISAHIKFCTHRVASYLGIDEKLVVDHAFPQDMQLLTVDELLLQRKQAVDSGAPYSVINAIDMQILLKQYQDSPDNVRWLQARERFRPFKEKNEAERMFILAELPEDDPTRVLFIHFEAIMDEIDLEQKAPPFYELNPGKQKELVYAKVDTYKSQSSAAVTFREGLEGEPAPTDIEAEAKAKLKGTVGGIQGIIEINTAVAEGKMTRDAGLTILMEVFGYSIEIANKMIDVPPIQKRAAEAKADAGIVPGQAPSDAN